MAYWQCWNGNENGILAMLTQIGSLHDHHHSHDSFTAAGEGGPWTRRFLREFQPWFPHGGIHVHDFMQEKTSYCRRVALIPPSQLGVEMPDVELRWCKLRLSSIALLSSSMCYTSQKVTLSFTSFTKCRALGDWMSPFNREDGVHIVSLKSWHLAPVYIIVFVNKKC